jgi:hypothetical protein
LSDRPSKKSRKFLYETLLDRDGPWCHYCGVIFESEVKKRSMTIDHVVPLIYGGPNHIDNMVLCCYRCNYLKDDYPADDPLFSEYIAEKKNTIEGNRKVHGHESILFTRQGNWSCLCGAHGTSKQKPKDFDCVLMKYGAFYRPDL